MAQSIISRLKGSRSFDGLAAESDGRTAWPAGLIGVILILIADVDLGPVASRRRLDSALQAGQTDQTDRPDQTRPDRV